VAAKVVTAAQMRACEERAANLGVPAPTLMEHAGRSIATLVLDESRRRGLCDVLVLVGPGNNGGDGLVAARHLVAEGVSVACYLWHRASEADSVRERAVAAGVPLYDAADDLDLERLRHELKRTDVVVDALLGTGLSRPLAEDLRHLLTVVRDNLNGHLVIAVDVPSGLNSDSGATDEATLPADITVTLGHVKAGLLVAPGAAYAGRVVRTDIGLPPGSDVPGVAELLADDTMQPLLPRRPRYSHKGSFGKALVVAGSSNYIGAAIMACEAAYRAGAGLVTLAGARSLHSIFAARLTETTWLSLPETDTAAPSRQALLEIREALGAYSALLVGPGLGRHPETFALVRALAQQISRARDRHPGLNAVVFDADALNALASAGDWWQDLGPNIIVTPHAAEMARLLATTPDEVERNRLQVAREAAERWRVVVVLKGAYTVVADPAGALYVNPVATPALATAGSGDVLAGAILGFASQGCPPLAAAMTGVYLHGRAGELLEERYGEAGGTAGDLIALLPEVQKRLRHRARAKPESIGDQSAQARNET
jgi:ADP-dependent NAD(P)H-hydrate dehydratase / NAD(P)H-hydrate epimerase